MVIDANISHVDMVAMVPAAGIGIRLGNGPKALLKLGEKTLLEIVVEKLGQVVPRIIVGAPEGMVDYFDRILDGRAECYEGGKTRQQTVCLLFKHCREKYVLVHDVASPFTKRETFLQVTERAILSGAASSFCPSNLPLGLLENETVSQYHPKEISVLSRTPQVFRREILKKALGKTLEEGKEFQSLGQVVVNAGYKIEAIYTEPFDIKITTPLDWEIAEKVIAPMSGLL